ncbi:hypothetical protein OROHE_008327 [Orobanche hederae]
MVPVDSMLAILVPRFTILVNKRDFLFLLRCGGTLSSVIITELEESPIAAYWCKGGYSFGSIMAHLAVNNFAGGPSPGPSNEALYQELWNACAGPLVNGERVYFFLQGHMEQAEPDTDEVYAKITLIPEQDYKVRLQVQIRLSQSLKGALSADFDYFTLVTKDTVDENVYEIAKRKLNLDAAVLKSGVEAENEA